MGAKKAIMKNESGSASVEFALFMPLFLLLIFGIIELGGAWYQKQILVHASRDAARYASIDEAGNAAEVENYVQSILHSSGFPYADEVTIDVSGAGGSPGDAVTVSISTDYAFPVLGKLASGMLGAVSLEATTVMRHE